MSKTFSIKGLIKPIQMDLDQLLNYRQNNDYMMNNEYMFWIHTVYAAFLGDA